MSTPAGVQYSGGYHECSGRYHDECGGYHEYISAHNYDLMNVNVTNIYLQSDPKRPVQM